MNQKMLRKSRWYRVLALVLAILFVIPASGLTLAASETVFEHDVRSEASLTNATLEELIENAAMLQRTITATSADRVPAGIFWVTPETMDTFNAAVAPFMPVSFDVMAVWEFTEPIEEPYDYFSPDPGGGPQFVYEEEPFYQDDSEAQGLYSAEAYYEAVVFEGNEDNLEAIAALSAAVNAFESARQVGTLSASESFIRNVELFPELWCSVTLRTAPAFNFTAGNTHELVAGTWERRDADTDPLTVWDNDFNIVEEVFIELPIDTDGDGKRDFIRATIRRPIETERYEELRIPAFLETSPYREGTLGLTVVDTTRPLSAGVDTSHYTFADVQSLIPRAADWPWDRDEAICWDGNAWVSGDQDDSLDITVIPPARPGGQTIVSRGNPVPVTAAAGGGHVNHNGNFAAYMFVRGYAIVTTNTVGNVFADGFTSTGGICETLSAIAAIQWLNGNARAFTCQEAIYEVDATAWSNGMVAMSGTSYNGTLPIAAAATGVEGLGLIIPIAAISNWYYYHRGGGGVQYPGRNNAWHAGFPGEEASDLALICFTRRRTDGAALNAIARGIPSYLRFHADNALGELLRANADLHWERMIADEDIASGDYNRFWDDRNYLATADRITAGIFVQHALNDFNVMPRHFDVLYRAVTEQSQAEIRLVLNRSGHTSFHTHDALFDWQHLWFDHFLYGIDNNALDMPRVQIQSSVTGAYESFDQWPIADSVYRRYFLAPPAIGAQSAAGTLSAEVPESREFTIRDAMNHWTESWNSTGIPPVGAQSVPPAFLDRDGGAGAQTGGRSELLNNWERALFDVNNLDAPSGERLVFVTEIVENVRMSGTIVASIEAATDVPWGNLTAAVVDIRPQDRGRVFGTGAAGAGAGVNTTVSRQIAAHNGVPAFNIVTPTAPVTPSGNNFWIDYKKVTSGNVDIQNPNQTDIVSYVEFPATIPHGFSRGRTYMEAGHQNYIPNYYFQTVNPTAGEFYTYVFSLEVMDWEFMAGDKLAIMIFTQDYRYTLTPSNPPIVTIRTGANTFVDIPSIGGFNTEDSNVETDPLRAAAALVRNTANAHAAESRPTAINVGTVTALGTGILEAVRAALGENEDFEDVSVEWVMPFAGERTTVSEPGIMAGTIRVSMPIQETMAGAEAEIGMEFVPLMFEILPQINVTPPDWWINRSLVPGLAEGNPQPRNDLEYDLFSITYLHGPRLWGSPNEMRAAQFVADRFQEMIDENPLTAQGAQARVWSTSLTSPNHPESLARGNANIGSFVRADGIHDFYGLAMPILDGYDFPTIQDANGVELVDLGIFPNLTLPAGTAGNVNAVVRFSTAHLDMQNQLLPALQALIYENEDLDGFEVVIIARFHPDRPIWNTMAAQLINRPQDLPPWNVNNQINFAMYPTIYGYQAMIDAGIPFMLVAHENLVDIQALAEAGELVKIYRHQRTHIHSPYLRLPASDDPNNPDMVVVVTGHFDSVATTQGVSDNAGSAAAMMETARRLAAMDRGGIEFRFFPHGGHEAGHNAGTEAFFPGGVGFSVAFDEFVRYLTAEGIADISVIYHHDMIISPGPTPAGAFMPNITVNGHWQTWRVPHQGNASPFNMAQHLLMLGAYNMRNYDQGLWAPGRVAVNATRGGAGEATNAYRDHDIVSSGKSTGLEVAYHNTRDNLKENYCYYRLRMAAEILFHGKLAAVEQGMSRRADFAVDLEEGELILNNAAQLFNTYTRVEGTLLLGGLEVPFVFEAPENTFSFTAPEGETAVGIRNVAAYGSTFQSVNIGATTAADLRVVLSANYQPTPEHLRSIINGLRVTNDMPAFSVGYPVQNPVVTVDGVKYISNRVFADMIGGQQHYWQTTMNQVVIHGSTTISGYSVDGDYVTVRVPGWRNTANQVAVTHPGWWTVPVAQSFHAYVSVGGASEQRVELSSVYGLSGDLGVHVQHMAAYLPLLFLADVFGFYVELDEGVYVLNIPETVEPAQYWTLSFNTGGGSLIDSIQVRHGTSVHDVIPEAPVREGYIFVGWMFQSGTLVDPERVQNINWHNTLVAIWEEAPSVVMWTITFDTGGGSYVPAVSVPAGTAFRDVVADITPPTREGYIFVTWRFFNWDATVCSGNFFVGWHNTLIAVWEAVPPPVAMWTITFDTAGGSYVPAVSVPAGTAFRDIVADIEAPVRAGYNFVTWRFFNWDATVCSGNFFANWHNTLIAVWEAV